MQANQVDQWLVEAATAAEEVSKVDAARKEAEQLKAEEEEEASVNADKIKTARVQADKDGKIAVEEELKAKSVAEEAQQLKVEGETNVKAEEEVKITTEGVNMTTTLDGLKVGEINVKAGEEVKITAEGVKTITATDGLEVEGEANAKAQKEAKITAEEVKVVTAANGAERLKKEESKVEAEEETAMSVQAEGGMNTTTEVNAKNIAAATEETEVVRVQDPSSLSSSISSSISSSLSTKEYGSNLRLHFRLFSKNVTQCKDKIKETAISIEKQSTAELKGIQMRFKQKEEKRREREAQKDLSVKRNEQLVHLEKLKVDVMDIRSEKARKLKRFLRRQKKVALKKKLEEESPTSILTNSNYFDDKETGRYDSDPSSDDVVVECTQKPNKDDQREEFEGAKTMEEMKLAARAEVEEEIGMAKEVKRHIMAELAEERDEDKLTQGYDDGEDLNNTAPSRINTETFVGDVPASTLHALLNCTEEELYDSDSSLDGDDIQSTITTLVSDIEGYDARLSDIEVMQSILLAENAAAEGIDEFKIGAEGIQLGVIESENGASLVDCPALMDPMEGAILLAESAAAQGEDEFKIGADGFSPVDPMESAIQLAERAAAQGVDDFKIGGSRTKKSLRAEFVSSCEDISSRARNRMMTLRQRLDRPALWRKSGQVTNE